MSDFKDIHDALSHAPDELGAISEHLFDLADAFNRTGNHEVAAELTRYGHRLDRQAGDIHQRLNELVFDRVQAADEATHNMVKAAMAASRKD